MKVYKYQQEVKVYKYQQEVKVYKYKQEVKVYKYQQEVSSNLWHSMASAEPAKTEDSPQHWFRAFDV